jgi:hypothetical protein
MICERIVVATRSSGFVGGPLVAEPIDQRWQVSVVDGKALENLQQFFDVDNRPLGTAMRCKM